MDNLGITWETILAVAGGFVLLLNAGKGVVNVFSPFKQLKERVEAQEKKLANDHLRLCREEEDTKMILRCLFVILQHERTGNETGLMDKTIDDLQLHLASRK